MAEVVNMPRLSDTMTEGVVANWHKNVGDDVSEGDLLDEIETDKAIGIESFQALYYILVQQKVQKPRQIVYQLFWRKR